MNCTSYEEMENIVKGDEKFMTLVDKLKELGKDDEIISIYTKSDDREMLLADARLDGERFGRAEGEKFGRAEGITETARNMLNKNFDPKIISEVTGMSESSVKALM